MATPSLKGLTTQELLVLYSSLQTNPAILASTFWYAMLPVILFLVCLKIAGSFFKIEVNLLRRDKTITIFENGKHLKKVVQLSQKPVSSFKEESKGDEEKMGKTCFGEVV